MTDMELIQALRKTAMVITAETIAWDDLKIAAADRLEALLAEVQKQICKRSDVEREIGRLEVQVEHLKAGKDTNVPTKWVSVEDRLPENSDEQVLAVVSGFYDGMYFHDALEIAEFPWDEGWILEAYPEWENPNVTYWRELPEPPSTEGVE